MHPLYTWGHDVGLLRDGGTLILSMLASILSCCTVLRAWAMLLALGVFEDILGNGTLLR